MPQKITLTMRPQAGFEVPCSEGYSSIGKNTFTMHTKLLNPRSSNPKKIFEVMICSSSLTAMGHIFARAETAF
jgi:hypothetical protein